MHKAGTRYLDETAAALSLQSADGSVRMVLAIAAEMHWEVRQLDVRTAFLYAVIEEEVFVAEPPGFQTNDIEKGLLVSSSSSLSMWTIF